MGELLQTLVDFAKGGALKLVEWAIFIATVVYNAIDQSMYLHHDIWARVLVGLLIVFSLLFVKGKIWRRIPKPKAPEETVIAPRPYRLLFAAIVLGVIYLVACFAAMD
ncbi:MAG: hypothetical protein LUE89_03015 [Clostridiales bacterium]|nr:hypothetical protein [Clostridiales bacterium]